MVSSTLLLRDSLALHIYIDEEFGSILIGTFIGLVLYGIFLHQIYRYTRVFSSDRLDLRVAVYLTLVLETTFMALSCYTCYYYLVTGYSRLNVLLYATHPAELLPALTGLILGTSHTFFARRAYLFDDRYRIVVLFAVTFLVAGIGFSVAITITEYHFTSIGLTGGFKNEEQWLILSALSLALCADITFTTVLTIALQQKRSGVKRTDSVMHVLALYTLATGLITSMSLLSFLLAVAIVPSVVGLSLGISIIVTQLFANTFLAALNSRQFLNDRIAPGGPPAEISGIEFRRLNHIQPPPQLPSHGGPARA